MRNCKLIFTVLFALMFVFQSCQKENAIGFDEELLSTRSGSQCGCLPHEDCPHVDEGPGPDPNPDPNPNPGSEIKGQDVFSDSDIGIVAHVAWSVKGETVSAFVSLSVLDGFTGHPFYIDYYHYRAYLLSDKSGLEILIDGHKIFRGISYPIPPWEELPDEEYFEACFQVVF